MRTGAPQEMSLDRELVKRRGGEERGPTEQHGPTGRNREAVRGSTLRPPGAGGRGGSTSGSRRGTPTSGGYRSGSGLSGSTHKRQAAMGWAGQGPQRGKPLQPCVRAALRRPPSRRRHEPITAPNASRRTRHRAVRLLPAWRVDVRVAGGACVGPSCQMGHPRCSHNGHCRCPPPTDAQQGTRPAPSNGPTGCSQVSVAGCVHLFFSWEAALLHRVQGVRGVLTGCPAPPHSVLMPSLPVKLQTRRCKVDERQTKRGNGFGGFAKAHSVICALRIACAPLPAAAWPYHLHAFFVLKLAIFMFSCPACMQKCREHKYKPCALSWLAARQQTRLP